MPFFVVTITNLTCFSVLNSFSNVRITVPTFGFGIRPRGLEPGPAGQQRALHPESDNNVKVHFAFFDLVSQIFHTYQLGACSFAASAFGPQANTATQNGTASTVRQYNRATDVLVRFTSVDAEVNGNVYAFNEQAVASSFSRDGFVDVVLFGRISFV